MTDPALPAFYILFGAFMVLVTFHLWRFLQRHFARPDYLGAESRALMVDVYPGAQPQSNGRLRRRNTLTPREVEVARLATQGRRNAEIANELHISVLTVETHLKHIFAKLKIHSRIELATMIRDLVD